MAGLLPPPAELERAAERVAQADAILVAAGAGMGVDSGLPDFRGTEGFWQAYPALGRERTDFTAIASPQAFASRPRRAWGFYGHRLALYRATAPHAGFATLQRWGAGMVHGCAVFTSNVDGQFQQAGFDPLAIEECHGSIHHLQCLAPCSDTVWPADGFLPEVDVDNCWLTNALPRCPHCGGLARPNVLMFGDAGWVGHRQAAQADRLARWLAAARRPVVVELGAGTAIPSVRRFGQYVAQRHGGHLVRINPREADVSRAQDTGLAGGAADILAAVDRLLAGRC